MRRVVAWTYAAPDISAGSISAQAASRCGEILGGNQTVGVREVRILPAGMLGVAIDSRIYVLGTVRIWFGLRRLL